MNFKGEKWKRVRSAVGKQATPRNVQSYCSGFNIILDRFMDYVRSARGADGAIGDIAYPLRLLLVECKSVFV